MVEEDQNELKMKMNKIISPTNNENMKKKQKKINHKQQQKLKNVCDISSSNDIYYIIDVTTNIWKITIY